MCLGLMCLPMLAQADEANAGQTPDNPVYTNNPDTVPKPEEQPTLFELPRAGEHANHGDEEWRPYSEVASGSLPKGNYYLDKDYTSGGFG
ncbi:MAG: hypothetical protein OSJ64_03885, partial [Firmicutes bacterium]|nr:hypothetical protein [Bacillota bacterium]